MASPSNKGKKKFTFTLKGIDPAILHTKYKLEIVSNLKEEKIKSIPKNCTKIGELAKIGDDIKKFSFVDESKKMHKCFLTMQNHSDGKFLPVKTDIACHWCCHQFSTIPLGCPLKYVPRVHYKKYFSEIIKEPVTIKETIPDYQEEIEDSNHKIKEITATTSYFESDGMFCSFNCCYAYIQEKKTDYEYDSSLNLLAFIYKELFGLDFDISPAPNWRLLNLFGGPLDIDTFRDNFYKVDFSPQGKLVTPPVFNQLAVNFLYEEKIKF